MEAGNKKEAAATLDAPEFISPNDEDLHRRLGSLLLETGDNAGRGPGIRQAVAAMKPMDPAGAITSWRAR